MAAPQQMLMSYGSSSFLCDIYPGAKSAYSVARHLLARATAAFQVKYASGASSADIGFSGELTDTAQLLSIVGSGTGVIGTLYDQAILGVHLANSTDANRPTVVSSGTLQTQGTRICAVFDSSDKLDSSASAPNYGSSAGLSGNATFSMFVVHKKTTNTAGCLVGWGTTAGSLTASGLYDDGSAGVYAFAGSNSYVTSVPANNTYYLTTVIKTAGAINATTSVYRNGSSVATSGHSTNTPNINTNGGLVLGQWADYVPNKFQGNVQELIIYASDQSANRAAIEANINAFYGIY